MVGGRRRQRQPDASGLRRHRHRAVRQCTVARASAQLSVKAGMGIIAGMDASSGAPVDASTTLADWLATPLGRYLLAREQAWFDRTVADIFGFHGHPDRTAGVPVPRAEPDRRALDASTRQPPARDPRRSALAAVRRELARPHRAAARARVHERSAPAAARGLPRDARRRTDRHLRLQSVQPVRRAALFRTRRDRRRGTAASSRCTGSKDWLALLGFEVTGGGLDCYVPPFAQREMARAVRFLRGGRRPLVADRAAASTTCARRRRSSACASSRRAWERPKNGLATAPRQARQCIERVE